jgi:hypothetical protein
VTRPIFSTVATPARTFVGRLKALRRSFAVI